MAELLTAEIVADFRHRAAELLDNGNQDIGARRKLRQELQERCGLSELQAINILNGFKDKLIRWNSDKLIGMESISKEEIDLRKVVKRMRGARPWHPLLQALRKELEG